MALSLNLSVDERNDNKVITLTDTSTGWGTDGDINFTDIDDSTYYLNAVITINTPTGVSTPYDINLYTLSGPFATQSDLVFPITATVLGIGDNNTLLEDGIYDIVYTVQNSSNVAIHTKTLAILITGQSQKAVYNKLRLVPIYYNSKVCKIRDIKEAELYYTFLRSIEKSAYIAKRTELLQMLETLQRLLLNGSNYPW